jgi:hypothetical protein
MNRFRRIRAAALGGDEWRCDGDDRCGEKAKEHHHDLGPGYYAAYCEMVTVP